MDANTVVYHTDGGSRGNPGPSSAGFWVPSLNMGGYRFLGTRTNNEAEYGGLILALEDALESGFGKIHVKSDSKLIVSQVNGDWNVKNPNLQALLDKVIGLIARLEHFSIEHIPREENSEADRQCNLCLDEYELDIRDDPTGFFS